MKSQITLILPAHNESQGIFETLLEIDKSVVSTLDLTIFVSEDGSTDGTRQEVMKASRQATNCKINLSPKSDKLGYSRAVLRGITQCKTKLIAFMDADGQYDPNDIQYLVKRLEKNTIVCGYRNPRNDPQLRLIYSRCFKAAYRLFGGPKLIDPSSPFIICHTADTSFLGSITPLLSYGFWWEFQMRIAAAGLKVIEIPVAHRKRTFGKTQVYKPSKMPRIIFTHLIGLIRLRKNLK